MLKTDKYAVGAYGVGWLGTILSGQLGTGGTPGEGCTGTTRR